MKKKILGMLMEKSNRLKIKRIKLKKAKIKKIKEKKSTDVNL